MSYRLDFPNIKLCHNSSSLASVTFTFVLRWSTALFFGGYGYN